MANQANDILPFVYWRVLCFDLPRLGRHRERRSLFGLPWSSPPDETAAVLERISGVNGQVAQLLYDSGQRLMQALPLKVKDADFGQREILDRGAKGAKAP